MALRCFRPDLTSTEKRGCKRPAIRRIRTSDLMGLAIGRMLAVFSQLVQYGPPVDVFVCRYRSEYCAKCSDSQVPVIRNDDPVR